MSVMIKNPPANKGDVRDMGSMPGSGRSPAERFITDFSYHLTEKPE